MTEERARQINLLREIIQIIFYTAGTLAMTAVYMNQLHTRELSLENNSYLRTIACTTSKFGEENRTPDYVELCYLGAEQANGNKLDRFGDAK